MNVLKSYDIELISLKFGEHHYTWEISDSFFEQFEFGLIEKGDLNVDLVMEKKETLINLHFNIEGKVELMCDRSLDAFDYPLSLSDNMILKYGEAEEEISDELEIIPANTQKINVARYIYEFISVAIPMKRLHPRYQDTDSEGIVYTSEIEEDNDTESDPRWEKLKNLKKNKK